MREEHIPEKLFKTTTKLLGQIEYADQDILNIVCENQYKELDNTYNYYCFRINNIKDVNIIHFVGIEKPWNTQCAYDHFFWKYALKLKFWNTSDIKEKLIKQGIKNLGKEIFSLKNQGMHKIVKLGGIKFKYKSKQIQNKRTLEELRHGNYHISERTRFIEENLIKLQNDIENLHLNIQKNKFVHPNQKCLLINDTSDDFHHGSCGTSSAILKRLKNYFKNIETISIDEIRKIQDIPHDYDEFINDEYYSTWKDANKEIYERIYNCDVVVINGEGCLSYYKWNRQFAYLAYIASNNLNKYTALINSSIYNIEENRDDSLNWGKILGATIDSCNYVALRDAKSIINCANYSDNSTNLTFDCLPLYITENYKYQSPSISNYVLISGGNNIPQDYGITLYKFIKENNLNSYKFYFLFSDVKTCSEGTGDLNLFNQLKEDLKEFDIELISAQTIDEWLSLINDAKLFISGRFHHTIAAAFLETPFLAFPTDTPKLKSMLEMLDAEENIITDNTRGFKLPAKILNIPKAKIIALANKNFGFLDKYYINKEQNINIQEATLL